MKLSKVTSIDLWVNMERFIFPKENNLNTQEDNSAMDGNTLNTVEYYGMTIISICLML